MVGSLISARNTFIIVILAAIASIAAIFSYQFSFDNQLKRQQTSDSYLFNSTVDTFHSELVRYKQLVRSTVDEDIFAITLDERNSTNIASANQRLKQLVNISGALDLYLMDTNGITLASSNWDLPRSFVGRTFAFRPYFIDAMRGQLGQYHALGITSLQRGIYLAHAVQVNKKNIGVIAVKIDVDRFENNWTDSPLFMARDRHGIVFMSNDQQLLYRSETALSELAIEDIRRTQQYPISALGILSPTKIKRVNGTALVELADNDNWLDGEYLATQARLQFNYLTLSMWAPTTNARHNALVSAMSIGFIVFAALLIMTTIWNRRQQMQHQQRLLESHVANRTQELRDANVLLENEIEERRAAQQELMETQANLIQASKLSALGQLSASLSHELNQPLAGIRNYADNARKFIARNEPEKANNNLGEISDLTGRMARIIKNLRTFSKPSQQRSIKPIDIATILEDAILLLDQRIQQNGITVHHEIPSSTTAIGGRVRLQQVLINILNNAIDALVKSATTKPTITVEIETHDDSLNLIISDNGPGIEEPMLTELFIPFSTTKSDDEGDGLGLGLYISYNIIESFGGTLNANNIIKPDGTIEGARFTIALKTS